MPPIVERPLPSQPLRIAQGCFYPAQARQALDSFLGPAGQTKSRQVWRLFGLPAAIFQIERDPPTASELSKLKYQKRLVATVIITAL